MEDDTYVMLHKKTHAPGRWQDLRCVFELCTAICAPEARVLASIGCNEPELLFEIHVLHGDEQCVHRIFRVVLTSAGVHDNIIERFTDKLQLLLLNPLDESLVKAYLS